MNALDALIAARLAAVVGRDPQPFDVPAPPAPEPLPTTEPTQNPAVGPPVGPLPPRPATPPPPPDRRAIVAAARDLSPAERDVFFALLGPESGEEIAARMSRALNTIRNHEQAIRKKLGVHSRAEMMSAFVAPPTYEEMRG